MQTNTDLQRRAGVEAIGDVMAWTHGKDLYQVGRKVAALVSMPRRTWQNTVAAGDWPRRPALYEVETQCNKI